MPRTRGGGVVGKGPARTSNGRSVVDNMVMSPTAIATRATGPTMGRTSITSRTSGSSSIANLEALAGSEGCVHDTHDTQTAMEVDAVDAPGIRVKRSKQGQTPNCNKRSGGRCVSNPSETHLPELTHVAGAKPNGRTLGVEKVPARTSNGRSVVDNIIMSPTATGATGPTMGRTSITSRTSGSSSIANLEALAGSEGCVHDTHDTQTAMVDAVDASGIRVKRSKQGQTPNCNKRSGGRCVSNPSETHLPELTHVAGAKPNGRYVVSS
ncbi:hypothetical protein THAOC_00777 [Thalassiosira oceanica]|uniref:Uncharacterized protein n=1 Tax=Thalassiosira oceanica TaxID=159749 RepID=K0TIH9_THAOC|nr:hypothetical protein THAOC_00777 [Thalassiosira oceanica]|eukprot:EJK77395.1 hypothetical protein THAOC_00777 [Thalassiosira oceanica]